MAGKALAGLGALALAAPAWATEGALGRQISGTSVQANIGIVSPEPVTVVNLSEIYLDGSLHGGREVPVGRNISVGLEGKLAFTLATVLKTWDTGTGKWNFASGMTVPYLWTKVDAAVTGPRGNTVDTKDSASDLFDLYFTPIVAGYHFSETEHIAFSLNFWAPTGRYNANNLANPSLNNWTFIPQIAYTGIFPESHWQLDAVTSLQIYTPNRDTGYHNAPLFGTDVMARRMFSNGIGAGMVVGTILQLGNDRGDTANRLNGFKGHDLALGPILTYDRKLASDRSLSMSLRWVPTVASTNRLNSGSTVMASVALVF
ncbi:SphA family protein [Achromobacter aloeverae]|uniref:Transporter n=1 Tax=Achromobacter aloeverae TaxID=1750518 RepID=A0A4Q1HNL2_9BURK|nr:transporter [Achromobacter aloeverae]RXN92387.1 transporter [Achromobacter aloeverae]